MSIYPDRKHGELTGRYRVEVQKNRKTLKGRANSLKEAKDLETYLRDRLEKGEGAMPPSRQPVGPMSRTFSSLTLGQGYERSGGLLWAGQETEMESRNKLKRIVSILGDSFSLDAFDANAVDTVVTTLKGTGIKDATINRYLSCISAFLTFCKRRDWKKTEVPELEWRDQDEGRIRWITYEEEKVLMDRLPPDVAKVVYVAIRTGMRASEIMTLTPEQIEPRWVRLWKTKNKTLRSVPISQGIYEVLAPLVSQGLPTYWQMRVEWERARRDMGLLDDPTFVFHACRHTYATRAVIAGVNIRVLQELMGHKTITTTLRYAHVDDTTKHDAALSSITFHEDKVGDFGWGISPQKAASCTEGSDRNRAKRPLRKNGVPPPRSANPFTPVRFRLGPPRNQTLTADND